MKKIVATVLAMGLLMSLAHAEETVGESVKATGHDMTRKMKKGAHRMEEAVCNEGDMKCAAKKLKHRAQETGNTIEDKAKETKDKVD